MNKEVQKYNNNMYSTIYMYTHNIILKLLSLTYMIVYAIILLLNSVVVVKECDQSPRSQFLYYLKSILPLQELGFQGGQLPGTRIARCSSVIQHATSQCERHSNKQLRVSLRESSAPPTASRWPPSVVRVERVTGRFLAWRHTPVLSARERVCSLAPCD